MSFFLRCGKNICPMGKWVLFLVLFYCCCLKMTESVSAYEIAGGYVTDTEGNRCGTLMWSLDSDGTFTVTGAGPGASYRPMGLDAYDEMCPWNHYRSEIKRVQFHCTFTGESLYHYEHGASINSWFINCVNLESFSDIPYGVTDMTAAFFGCEKLTCCGKIPDSVAVMHYTFTGCKSLVNPPELPKSLKDMCLPMRKNTIVHVPAYALGLTFSGCTSLVSTPSFENCPNIHSLVGTFVDCTALVTIQNIPDNIDYFFNTFNNCENVRGVLSVQAPSVTMDGIPFEKISQNNEYLLFVKAEDRTLFEKIKTQAGNGFRGYEWDDAYVIFFDSNGGSPVTERKVIMEYGVDYANHINENYSRQINSDYYGTIPLLLGELPVPVRNGLSFEGWYFDREFKKKVNTQDVINPDTEGLERKYVTLYAKWADKKSPDICHDYLDTDWRNKPVTVTFDITDNENGGIRQIQLRKLEENEKILYRNIEFSEDDRTHYQFSHVFGDVPTKLYEGITQWEIFSEDTSGNVNVINLTIRLDYTPPVIYTDSPYDDGEELIFDDRDGVRVWCEDSLSRPGILKINPSNVQNTFIDEISTPYRLQEDFRLNYSYATNPQEYGYVLYAADKAGNYASRVIVTDGCINSHVRRIIPRANYD